MELKNLITIVYTLKSGKEIKILVEEVPESDNSSDGTTRIDGFIATPLIIEKTAIINAQEIAAVEITKDPHITWTLTSEPTKTVSLSGTAKLNMGHYDKD